MKLSTAKARVLRFDINSTGPDTELSVDVTNEFDVNDYINPGKITVVIKWKVNALDEEKNEVIGYLNEATATIDDVSFDQDDLFLIKTFVESSFVVAERQFQAAFVYQNKLPVIEYYPIAVGLLALIANQTL